MHEPSRTRYLPFGYNRWKQKPLRIATPGGQIFLTREKGGTVRIDIEPDGSRMADHLGEVETPVGRSAAPYTVRLIHEEIEREQT